MITKEYYDKLIEKLMELREHIEGDDYLMLESWASLCGYLEALETVIKK